MSAGESTSDRVLDVIQSLRLEFAAIEVGKLKLTLWVEQSHVGQFTAHIQTLKSQPDI